MQSRRETRSERLRTLMMATTNKENGNDPDIAQRVPASPVPRVLVVLALVLAIAAIVVAARRLGSSSDAGTGPLRVVAEVPAFHLIERSGRPVTRDDLLGKVWVADFIFTTCAGPCPLLTMRMRSLHKTMQERFGDKVKCVSFTVDPEHDQPPVLRKYADRHDADPVGWWFLTGQDESAMQELVTAGFLQALSPAKGGSPIIHSTLFVMVDKRGRIRGWHEGLDPASKKLLLGDVEALLAER